MDLLVLIDPEAIGNNLQETSKRVSTFVLTCFQITELMARIFTFKKWTPQASLHFYRTLSFLLQSLPSLNKSMVVLWLFSLQVATFLLYCHLCLGALRKTEASLFKILCTVRDGHCPEELTIQFD